MRIYLLILKNTYMYYSMCCLSPHEGECYYRDVDETELFRNCYDPEEWKPYNATITTFYEHNIYRDTYQEGKFISRKTEKRPEINNKPIEVFEDETGCLAIQGDEILINTLTLI